MKKVELMELAQQGYAYDCALPFNKKTGEPLRSAKGNDLSLFIVRKLSETYDLKANKEVNVHQAIKALESAQFDLENVKAELYKALQPVPLPVSATLKGGEMTVEFDAHRWFAQASQEKLVEMIGSGFNGNCSEIAQHMAKHHRQVQKALVSRKDCEVKVNQQEAMNWIKANRPAVTAAVFTE
jgi:hypothetical protein